MPLIAGSNHGNLVGNLEWSKHCGRKRRCSRITAQQHSIMSHTFEEKSISKKRSNNSTVTEREKALTWSLVGYESSGNFLHHHWQLRKKKNQVIFIQVEKRATIGSGTEKLDTVCVPALDLYQGRQGWGRWKNHHFTTTFAFHHSRSTSNKPLTINRKFKNIVIHRLFSTTYLSLNFFLNSDHDGKNGWLVCHAVHQHEPWKFKTPWPAIG